MGESANKCCDYHLSCFSLRDIQGHKYLSLDSNERIHPCSRVCKYSLNNLWPSDISIWQNICGYINLALFLIATLNSIIANAKPKHFPKGQLEIKRKFPNSQSHQLLSAAAQGPRIQLLLGSGQMSLTNFNAHLLPASG